MAEENNKNIPEGYEEGTDGIIRRADDGTPLKWRDCKTADEKILWHQHQAEKIKKEESERADKKRTHRLVESAAHIEYLISTAVEGQDEANEQENAETYKESDRKVKMDRTLARELAELWVEAHPDEATHPIAPYPAGVEKKVEEKKKKKDAEKEKKAEVAKNVNAEAEKTNEDPDRL